MALYLFYLLLSLSEHLGFCLAAAAIVALITGYACAILEGKGRSLLLGAILTTLYGYLYPTLRLASG